jgi:hypothetical protein
MAQTDKYGHTADGKDPGKRTTTAGYKFCIIAENIAYEFRSDGFTTEQLAKSLMNAWENSPEHRKNLLDSDIYDIGVGVAHSAATGRYYAVQEFGRPRSMVIKFTLVNQTDQEVHYSVDDKTFALPTDYTQVHEVCRPPALRLGAGDNRETAAKAALVHPQNGERFIVRKDDSGRLSVEKAAR